MVQKHKEQDAYVKWNEFSSPENIKLDPGFVFKGTGTRTKGALPDSVDYQWSLSGSYRLD